MAEPKTESENPMSKFIELPTGDLIHLEAIMAIRLRNPRPKVEKPHEFEVAPGVLVDFVVGEHGNTIILDCGTIEQRDKLAVELRSQLVQIA